MVWCTAQCKMLVTLVWNFYYAFLCHYRSLVGHTTLEDEWYMGIKASKFTVFERFFGIIICCVSTLSLHIELVERESTYLQSRRTASAQIHCMYLLIAGFKQIYMYISST